MIIHLSNYGLNEILLAFALTLIAGLSTAIGGLIALFAKQTNKQFLSITLGFSAGVMIYVSFVELFFTANNTLTIELGNNLGPWINLLSFFGGMGLIALIDNFIPEVSNPHEVHDADTKSNRDYNLLRVGVFTALAIAIHNFPEGIATFMASLSSPTLAIGVTIAIALHNIPEGISVYVPVYYATGSKKKAFMYSFLSGLAEPLGAIIGFLVLQPFLSNTLFGIIFAAVAGIMIYISLDELLPTAHEYGQTHSAIFGIIAGMAVMAVSMLLF